ncbi:unnamed protein product, partial [Oikopleura dioica]
LPSVVSTMNKCKNVATKCSPFEVIYGRKPSFDGIQMHKNPAADSPQAYVKEVAAVLARTRKFVDLAQEESDIATKIDGKSKIKQIVIEIGDRILLKRSLSAETKINKNPYTGPFEVINTNGVIVRIDMDGKLTWVHRHHCVLQKQRALELDPDFVDLLYDDEPPQKAPDPVIELPPERATPPARRYPTRERKPPDRYQPK